MQGVAGINMDNSAKIEYIMKNAPLEMGVKSYFV
jgi:hypothetical protein